MTVSSTTSRADYNGNGLTTSFSVPFYFLDNSHVQVLYTNTSTGVVVTWALGSDYTLSGAGNPSGGTLLASVAPATGYKLSILRDIPVLQSTHYVPNDPFPAESHEQALDKLTMIDQQQDEVLSRALTLPPQTSGVSTELPSPTANQLVGWNSAGDGLTNIDPNSLLTIAGSSGFSDQLASGDGVTTQFTLSAQPGATANLKVFVSGIDQRPTIDWTLSGYVITFLVAPPAGTNNIYFNWGQTLGIGVPSDTSVTTAKIADNNVTTAKLADGAVTLAKLAGGYTKGDILAANGSGALARVTVGTNGKVLVADSTQTSGVAYGERGAVATFSTAGATVADGLTRYLGTAFVSAAESDVAFTAPFAGTAKNLYVSCSGAGSGTRTYTVRKNGVDQTITCLSTAAATTANDTTHSFNFVAGDVITLKLQTTGGSTTAGHNATLELVKTSG